MTAVAAPSRARLRVPIEQRLAAWIDLANERGRQRRHLTLREARLALLDCADFVALIGLAMRREHSGLVDRPIEMLEHASGERSVDFVDCPTCRCVTSCCARAAAKGGAQ